MNIFKKTRFLLILLVCLTCKAELALASLQPSSLNQALLLKLPSTDLHFSKEIGQLQIQMTKSIAKADYKHALAIAMLGLKKYPKNFLLQTYFAMIIGDYAVQHKGGLKQNMLDKSETIFKKLMPEVESQPKAIRFYFKNEYTRDLSKCLLFTG